MTSSFVYNSDLIAKVRFSLQHQNILPKKAFITDMHIFESHTVIFQNLVHKRTVSALCSLFCHYNGCSSQNWLTLNPPHLESFFCPLLTHTVSFLYPPPAHQPPLSSPECELSGIPSHCLCLFRLQPLNVTKLG